MKEPKIADKNPAVLDLESGTYYWCRCGLANEQPFCDGSHAGTGIAPIKFEIDKPARIALCNCKRAASGHCCDGTHSSL